MKNLLYGKKDNHKERKLLPLNAEIASPSTYWQQTWRYDKLKGLGPELTTFVLKMVGNTALWGQAIKIPYKSVTFLPTL